MMKTFFVLGMIAVLGLSACAPSPTPTLALPTKTAVLPTQTMAAPTPTRLSPTLTPLTQGRTLLVTSAADSGPGTLRQALLEAQSGDTITFDPSVFPPDAPATISLSNGLPPLGLGYMTIDASNAGVILDGSNITVPEFQHGITITSDNNIVRGLQIVGFSDAGIGLYGQYNIIGGDRSIGDGPLGQGNLISGNHFGIGLWGETTSRNTIRGNYIGITLDGTAARGNVQDGIHSNGAAQNLVTDNVIGGNGNAGIQLCCVLDGRNVVTGNLIGVGLTGIPLGNDLAGVLIHSTHHNVVGPGNVIAHNLGGGMSFWENTPYNTVTQNSIHDNGGQGIGNTSINQGTPQPPLILNFDLQAGTVTGATCPNCTVEIFSDTSDEGGIYEGRTEAGKDGAFTFAKGAPFTGPILTATATDPDGNTSEFSLPTQGNHQNLRIQVGNVLPMLRLQTKPPNELADNRIGDTFPLDRHTIPCRPASEDEVFTHVVELGFKWVRLSLDTMELEPVRSTGNYSQFEINQCQDEIVTLLSENDITILYTLVYWDENLHTENYPDYQNEDEIQLFLDYTRLIVRHFKGSIQYYEILNEALVYVEAADYVNLVHRVIPVILEEDPRAKIVVGGATDLRHDYSREYFFDVLHSDIMPLIDGIATHPMYGVSPQYDETRQYYENYPSLIQEIKDVASLNGFRGEYFAEEMVWRTSINPYPPEPWQYTPIVAAKYYARGILMNLGMGLWAGIGGGYDTIPPAVMAVQSLSTTMAGASPDGLTGRIESEAENIMTYGFSLPNGDHLFALWTNGTAVDDDPGISATLTFPGTSAQKVIGIDVLNGIEQELITETVDANLVIRDLLVKDYPIILRLTD